MSKLTMVIEVPDAYDPTLTDPEEVGQEVVLAYTEWATANGYDPVDLVSAEWKEQE